MTLAIFVTESVQTMDMLIGATKRLLAIAKKLFFAIGSFVIKRIFVVKNNGNKAPPKSKNQKGDTN